MIVRDEARFLPGCLASIEGVVDEIVVLDTGSTDETMSIAEQHGAVTASDDWRNDFAEARNAALAHATGDYVLVLDADERLSAGAGEVLREACSSQRADCFLLPLHNADRLDASPEDILSGERRVGGVTYLPRLLRRTADLAWEGEVHENPRTWLKAPGRQVLRLEAPLIHYGYADEVVAQREKVARNLDLLRLRCEREPDRPDPRIYIAKSHLQQGRLDEAHAELHIAWTLARRLSPDDRQRPIIAMMVNQMLRVLLRKPAELARPFVEEALDWGLEHPNVMYYCGLSYERLAGPVGDAHDLEMAEAVYCRGLAWCGVPLLPLEPSLQSWLMPLRLGLVRCKRGDYPGALEVLAPALAERPADPALRVAAAEALDGLQQPLEALKMVEPALTPAVSDGWWVAGRATLQLGDADAARVLLIRAKQIGSTGELHRAWSGSQLLERLSAAS